MDKVECRPSQLKTNPY